MEVVDSAPEHLGPHTTKKQTQLYSGKNLLPVTADVSSDLKHKSQDEKMCWFVSKKNYMREKMMKQKKGSAINSHHVKYYPDIIDCDYDTTANPGAYDMSSRQRGVAVIFNMHNFDSSTCLSENPREGTNKDSDDVKDVFIDLGFIVHQYNDATRQEIFRELRYVAKSHSELSCFVCVILSHGTEGNIYAYDGAIHLSDIFSTLEIPEWKGKPKLFFVEACREEISYNLQKTLPWECNNNDIYLNNKTEKKKSMLLPRQTDFLYSHSTTTGSQSWRHTELGSRYIQELCKTFRRYSHTHHLSEMITFLQNSMLSHTEHYVNKQTTSIVNQLKKDLYFNPPYGPITSPLIKRELRETFV